MPVSATSKANLVVVAYRGTSTTNPVAVFANGSGAAAVSHATPLVNAPGTGRWAISYWIHKDSTSTTLSPPSGVVVRSNSTQSGAGRVVGLVADSGTAVATTSYGGLVATGAANSSNAFMWTIILAPA